jgi:hypothetical protein
MTNDLFQNLDGNRERHHLERLSWMGVKEMGLDLKVIVLSCVAPFERK